MHKLPKAVSGDKPRFAAFTALPLVGTLTLAVTAQAQQPQPPFGPQPPPGQPTAPQPGPFGPQPSPGQPGPFGPQPPPGELAPGQFGPQPAPGQFGPQPAPGQFGPQPAPGQFGPEPAPGQFGPQPPGQPAPGQPAGDAGFSFGAQASLGEQGAQADVKAPSSTGWDEQERALSLINQSNLTGSTGLLRTSYAGSGAPGTFRVGFLLDWFSTSGFLCDPAESTPAGQPITCTGEGAEDSASHVGGFFTINATPLPFLEGYAALRTYANANDQGRPALLQVLGDTTFGVKAFTPPRIGKPLTFGGEVQLLLLNGTGDVGLAGGGTSAVFRGLASLDLRKPEGKGFPLRVNLNLGYKLDNSGVLVEDVEAERAKAFTDGRDRQPISRIERFGLGINRVDFFQTYLGVEVPLPKVQPYLEYTIDIPVNRQGYECHTGRVSRGDVCLGLDDFSAADPQNQGGPGYSAVPSRLSIGVRATPFEKAFRGLSAHAAFDIGLSATSVFIEEVAPQAPWTLYLGVGYAYDTKQKEPAPPPPPQIIREPQLVPAPQSYIRGIVHEQGKPESPVADAIVSIEGMAQPPYATGPDGRFLTRHLEPGTYTLDVRANGYKPGTCQATIVATGTGLGAATAQPAPFGAQPGQPAPFGAQPGQPAPFGAQPGQPAPFGAQPGQPAPFDAQPAPFGAQPGQPAPFGAQPGQPAPFGAPLAPFGAQPGQPDAAPGPAPQGPTYVDVDCSLEALPKTGNVVGTVKDAESNEAVAGATVRLVDAAGREVTATTDATGAFRFPDLAAGSVTLKTEAQGYMTHVDQAEVRTSEDARVALSVNKRPKVSLVKVLGNEIKISKQIHFETDSAKILGDSNALMEEIADVLQRNPNIRKVEIQGHTDNTGGREHNQTLSEARAKAVRAWLIKAGVDESRLLAKGYGQERPIAPNVTPGNKAKNRRVQFIILEK